MEAVLPSAATQNPRKSEADYPEVKYNRGSCYDTQKIAHLGILYDLLSPGTPRKGKYITGSGDSPMRDWTFTATGLRGLLIGKLEPGYNYRWKNDPSIYICL